jgi:hypothetical protein
MDNDRGASTVSPSTPPSPSRRSPSLQARYDVMKINRKAKLVTMTTEEKAKFVAPTSYEEGKVQRVKLEADVQLVKGQLKSRIETDFPNLNEYRDWKARAGIALSYMKVRLILLQDWLHLNKPLEIHAGGISIPKQSFVEPTSLGDAETEIGGLTADIMALTAQLSALKNDSPEEWRMQQKGLAAKRRQMEIRLRLLKNWRSEELRRIDQRKTILGSTIDSNNPANLILHALHCLGRLIKKNSITPDEECKATLDGLRSYLRANGYSN